MLPATPFIRLTPPDGRGFVVPMRSEMTHVSMTNAPAASARANTNLVATGSYGAPAWSRIRGTVCPIHVGHTKFGRPGGRGGAS